MWEGSDLSSSGSDDPMTLFHSWSIFLRHLVLSGNPQTSSSLSAGAAQGVTQSPAPLLPRDPLPGHENWPAHNQASEAQGSQILLCDPDLLSFVSSIVGWPTDTGWSQAEFSNFPWTGLPLKVS